MQPRQSHRGFSLIELMISLVVGLIVSGAALALVASIIKSNTDTVRSTRLTQELRATAEVIARELMRARGVNDPISNLNVATINSCDNVVLLPVACTVNCTCITLGYDCDNSTNGTFKSFALANNKVYVKSPGTTCATSADVQISSNAVNITALTFTGVGSADAGGNYGAYTIAVAGQLANQPSVSDRTTVTNPTRSYTQTVWVRAISVSN